MSRDYLVGSAVLWREECAIKCFPRASPKRAKATKIFYKSLKRMVLQERIELSTSPLPINRLIVVNNIKTEACKKVAYCQ